MSEKQDFLRYQAQTSDYALGLEIEQAKGSYIYAKDGKVYLDFVAGLSVCNLGHCHTKVIDAIQKQSDKYLHVMVYGEYIQTPQLELCKTLASFLPSDLSCTYLVNSGTEAIEGSLKLAKRYTGRSEIVSCKDAYHGNTQGSMSVMGIEASKRAYRPLLPNVKFITYNCTEDLSKITYHTACVIMETIQGGAGFITPKNDYLKKIRQRCDEVGALLIFDEIQPGFGRTGKLFGFENYDVHPNIIAMGKAMGGGMPIGAFTSSEKIMSVLKYNPMLGHITTFGGHPVIAAAALATLQEVTKYELLQEVLEKEKLFRALLVHSKIKEVRGKGLMLAIIVDTPEICQKVVLESIKQGLILFFLLFEKKAIRITPPLTISNDEVKKGCNIILNCLDTI